MFSPNKRLFLLYFISVHPHTKVRLPFQITSAIKYSQHTKCIVTKLVKFKCIILTMSNLTKTKTSANVRQKVRQMFVKCTSSISIYECHKIFATYTM